MVNAKAFSGISRKENITRKVNPNFPWNGSLCRNSTIFGFSEIFVPFVPATRLSESLVEQKGLPPYILSLRRKLLPSFSATVPQLVFVAVVAAWIAYPRPLSDDQAPSSVAFEPLSPKNATTSYPLQLLILYSLLLQRRVSLFIT